ncbi:hypothetical protein VTH82DRAFT_5243 [Thermothelomyces myriococcoides]
MQPPEMFAHTAGPPSPPRKPRSPVREAFAFFSLGRKKSTSDGGPPRSVLLKRSRAPSVSSPSTSAYAEPESYRSHFTPGVKPSLDMARGHADDRYSQNPTVRPIVVLCEDVAVTVPVTKETSTAELLEECGKSLANLGRPINPDKSVVIEPCTRPGLERRLRQYERIWDVTNAWDQRSSNALVILPSCSDPNGELSLSSVPKTQSEPEGFVLPLYFLQRPGKWSQRYITLKENGQIFVSKKKEWKTTDKDVAKLCQLSDFDLYVPTEVEMKKHLRPPKRYCYAIRSQEKASLFLDSTHYVQFFCTDDANVARQFRSGVHRWRSWYLAESFDGSELETKAVNRSELKTKTFNGSEPKAKAVNRSELKAKAVYGSELKARAARGSPGSFAGGGGEAVPPVPSSLRETKAAVFESTGLLGNGYDERKQQAMRQHATERQRPGPVVSSDDGPFIDGPNLLNNHAAPDSGAGGGRRPSVASDSSYDKWERQESSFPSASQRSADQRNVRPSTAAPAASSTASALARRPTTATQTPSRTRSIRRRSGGEEAWERYAPPLPQQQPVQQQQQQLQRRPTSSSNNSIHGPPQPLVDLTPSFVEPPQWSREKKGRGVRAPQGKPLVELATGPPAPTGPTSRFAQAAAPPKPLIRRPDPMPTGASSSTSVAGGGPTLMQQYDLRKAAVAATAGGGGLSRSNTMRSVAGPAGSTSAASAAAYMQARARMMGSGEEERERARHHRRLRNGDVWVQ